MLNKVRGFFGVDDETPDEPAATPPEAIDLQWVMSDQRGRRYIWRQLELAGVYRLSYTGEAHSTDFNEGQRNTGLRLMDELVTHCQREYHLMLKENQA